MRANKPFFECEYCDKKFLSEKMFNKHTCDRMRKFAIMDTNKGKAAFEYYKTWMNYMNRRATGIDTFIDSKYFVSFIEFVSFSNNMGIPDPKYFIKYTTQISLMPTHWRYIEVFEEYIEFFETTKTPNQLASYTVETLYDLSRIFECEVNHVFDHIDGGDLLKLISCRKLSPWILLFSTKFRNYMRFSVTSEEKILLESIVNPQSWLEKFTSNPEAVKMMKEIVKELDI